MRTARLSVEERCDEVARFGPLEKRIAVAPGVGFE
jgi:hypothetical protein